MKTILSIKAFQMMEIEEAYAFAADGGLALHLHNIIVDPRKAPRCFVDAIARGENIAHLFCKDVELLIKTARKVGVKVIVVENKGTKRQHIDLCGAPLRRAEKLAEEYRKHQQQIDYFFDPDGDGDL